MKSKQTKGFWKVKKWFRTGLKDGFEYAVTDGRGHGLATMCQKGEHLKTKHNAELLASAPELLEALNSVLAGTGWHHIEKDALEKAYKLCEKFKT